MPTHSLKTAAEVAELVKAGKTLLLAGDESLLTTLPEGNWIGGTSANFMAEDGGTTTKDKIFVTDLSDIVAKVAVRTYDSATLMTIGQNYPENGFTALVVPGLSAIHALFAKEVQGFDGVFNAPLAGWISGVPVEEIGKTPPKAFAGSGTALSNQAAAMHVSLPEGFVARLDIINLFTQSDGDLISFPEDGFSSEGDCAINGKPANLAAYILEKKIDTKCPLVADYNGAMINVSIQAVDAASRKVSFYAPVFKGIEYRFARPVDNYIDRFAKAVSMGDLGTIAFSCNCILNFLYANLEGKKTGALVGPITFGEVAYMLLNQTLVYLSIDKIS
jgi:hypothetical protein